jgi:hypothetical protein
MKKDEKPKSIGEYFFPSRPPSRPLTDEKPKSIGEYPDDFPSTSAMEIAEQVLPILWYKLNVDTGGYVSVDGAVSLPEELKLLLGHRLYAEVHLFYLDMVRFALNPDQDNEKLSLHAREFWETPVVFDMHSPPADPANWVTPVVVDMRNAPADPANWPPIIRRTYRAFLQEWKAYKKKHHESMDRTIWKAKKADATAICKLLQWDKTWICFPFIHNEFSRRQWIENDRFFEMVADALKKKSGIRKTRVHLDRHGPSKDLLWRIKLYVDRYGLAEKDVEPLYDRLLEMGYLPQTDEYNPDSFKKDLKRHHII